MTQRLWVGGLGAAFTLLLGCSPAAPGEVTVLAETIGPEGGTIRGEAATQFEGVELTIPPGALAAATPVRILPINDDTPLPTRALRVGTQFTIEPAGTPLASAATLTLPVDTETVQRFAQGASDVKVWLRDDAGWKLQTAGATADGSVSIPLSSFTTAAAGISLNLSGFTCSSCSPIPTTCTSATGFCLRSLGKPTPLPQQFLIAVDAKAVYYPVAGTSSSPGTAVARLELSSGAVTGVSSHFSLNTGFRPRFAVDLDGSVWAGLAGRLGNAHFSFGGGVTRYEFDGISTGLGALLTPSGTLVRFASGQAAARAGGVTAPFAPLEPSGYPFGGDRSVGDQGYWISIGGGAVGKVQPGKSLFLARVLVEGFSGAQDLTTIVGAGDGSTLITPTLATIYFPSSVPPRGLAYAPPGSPLRPFALPFTPYDIDFDNNVGLWIAGNTAEIHYLARDLGLLSAPLTSATDPTSPEYVQHVPMAVRALPDGSCVVMLYSGEVVVIRRSGT